MRAQFDVCVDATRLVPSNIKDQIYTAVAELKGDPRNRSVVIVSPIAVIFIGGDTGYVSYCDRSWFNECFYIVELLPEVNITFRKD